MVISTCTLENLELKQLLEFTISLGETPGPLSNIEVLKLILEHDRWKTEATFAHELELEQIRSQNQITSLSQPTTRQRRHSTPTPSPDGPSEEDIEFNSRTTFGAGDEKHIGLVAKTKVWEGANSKSATLVDKWAKHFRANNKIPAKDLRDGRYRTLLRTFLWATGCAERLHRWPEAPDKGFVTQLKKEIKEGFSKFSSMTIVSAYESLKVFWDEFNDGEVCAFNSTLIADILDEAYSYVKNKEVKEIKSDVKNSPYFLEFAKEFPEVSLDTLERYYIRNRENFVAGGIGCLRRHFTENLPPELADRYSATEWPKKWHLHITTYEPQWTKALNQIKTEHSQAQTQWKKELTS